MVKILVVEDDELISTQITKFIENAEMAVELLTTGEHVVSQVKKSPPDLIVLDLSLPKKDGITCCSEIREFSDIPIIMLTARVEEVDRLIGLSAGADDYICKPFSGQELVLRIKAILRRIDAKNVVQHIKINPDKFTIHFKHAQCELTTAEFHLFEVLFNRPATIFSRTQLLDQAYAEYKDVSDRTIDSHIRNIRKKVSHLGLNEEIIESVYGAGYRYKEPAL